MPNKQQAQQFKFGFHFNFKIKYQAGKAGGKPDVLIRRSEDLNKIRDERLKFQNLVVLKPENIKSQVIYIAANTVVTQENLE